MSEVDCRLTAVRIDGFRSCSNVTLRPDARLSVLIGPNAAGKTSILQGITMLGAWRSVRRYRRDETGVTSQCRIWAEFQVGKVPLVLRSTVKYTLDEENREDVVSVHDDWRLGSLAGRRTPRGKWTEIDTDILDMYQLKAGRLVARLPFQRDLFRSRARSLMPPPGDPELTKAAWRAHQLRSQISYYSASQFTNPASCPSYVEIDTVRGSSRTAFPRRREHQRFLFDLQQLYTRDPTTYAAYIQLVGASGLNLISKIHWKTVAVSARDVEVRSGGRIVKNKRQRVLIVPTVRSGQDRLSFNQLSEGTFKTLALIFYLVTDSNKILLIEEPEVFVHHGLLTSIVELIKGQSATKQIVFSTHSDFVLDQVAPENVFVVSRELGEGTSVRNLAKGQSSRKVADLKEFLRTSGSLGEYWRQGGLEG